MLAPKLAAVCLETTDPEVVSWLESKRIEIVPVGFRETMAWAATWSRSAATGCSRSAFATDLNAKLRALGFDGVRPRHEPVPARRRRRALHVPAAAPRARCRRFALLQAGGSSPSRSTFPVRSRRDGSPTWARTSSRSSPRRRSARQLRARAVRRAGGRHGGRDRDLKAGGAGDLLAGADVLLTSSRPRRWRGSDSARRRSPRIRSCATSRSSGARRGAGGAGPRPQLPGGGRARRPGRLPDLLVADIARAGSGRRSPHSRCWPSGKRPAAAAPRQVGLADAARALARRVGPG